MIRIVSGNTSHGGLLCKWGVPLQIHISFKKGEIHTLCVEAVRGWSSVLLIFLNAKSADSQLPAVERRILLAQKNLYDKGAVLGCHVL